MENSKKRISWILGLSMLVIVVFLFYVLYKPNDTTPVGETEKTLTAKLVDKSPEFAAGEGFLKSGKFSEAAEQYKKALQEADGYIEESLLKYKIGLSYVSGDNPIEGIKILKEVVANENYSSQIRAYAVQQLGSVLYGHNTKEVESEVFKGVPYETFTTEGDMSLARRKLFEYASSFYPLGIPELRIAKWYSTEILQLKQKGQLSEAENSEISKMTGIVRQKLLNAQRYLEEIKNQPAVTYSSEVLFRTGTVLGDMMLSGDTSFPNPEISYKESLNVAVGNVRAEATTKYSYAVFLAKMYGTGRATDIKELLKDFYTGDKYKQTGVLRMIKNEKNNVVGNKNDILLLASIDTDFASLLKTLGWSI